MLTTGPLFFVCFLSLHSCLVLLSQRRHERGVDMVSVEYEQTKDRILRKYDMWDDQQASSFLSFFSSLDYSWPVFDRFLVCVPPLEKYVP